MDKLELNSQIERLIDSKGHDVEARDVVLAFGKTIRPGSPVQFEGRFQSTGGAVSGQTEHGLVSIEDDKTKTKEFLRGVVQERVGYYKITREQIRKWDRIIITHFWKAEMGTESDTELAQEWALALDLEGNAIWFGERGIQHVRTLRLTKWISLQIDREQFEETWPDAGPLHKGMLRMGLTIGSPEP